VKMIAHVRRHVSHVSQLVMLVSQPY